MREILGREVLQAFCTHLLGLHPLETVFDACSLTRHLCLLLHLGLLGMMAMSFGGHLGQLLERTVQYMSKNIESLVSTEGPPHLCLLLDLALPFLQLLLPLLCNLLDLALRRVTVNDRLKGGYGVFANRELVSDTGLPLSVGT